MKELWVEKYRPNKVSEYVFRDLLHKQRIENWISEGGIPHLLFSGGAGTGKTSTLIGRSTATSTTNYSISSK